MRQLLTRVASFTLLAALAVACTKQEDVTPAAPAHAGEAASVELAGLSAAATRDNNLALGNPSGAVASTSYPTN